MLERAFGETPRFGRLAAFRAQGGTSGRGTGKSVDSGLPRSEAARSHRWEPRRSPFSRSTEAAEIAPSQVGNKPETSRQTEG